MTRLPSPDVSAGRSARDPANRVRGQLGLRKEPRRRAFIDEISEVDLRMGGDQDDHGRAPALLGQPLGEFESALTRERDVDEHDLRLQLC